MYYLAQNNAKTGPFTLEQLRVMWRDGGVYPQTLFWEEGMADWQPLGTIAADRLGLDPATLATAASPSSTDAPLSPPEPSAYGLPGLHLPAVPVPAAPSTAGPSGPLPVGGASTPAALNSLIGPTRLSGDGTTAPAGTTLPPDASNEVPRAAYLSLALSLLTPFFLLFSFVGWFLGAGMIVGAIVCGHTARATIKQSGGRLPGKGIATAGLVIGYLLVVLSVVGFVGFLVWAFSASEHFHP